MTREAVVLRAVYRDLSKKSPGLITGAMLFGVFDSKQSKTSLAINDGRGGRANSPWPEEILQRPEDSPDTLVQ